MSIEAMKQALEALESDNPDIQLRAAIALRQAIEQAEPVGWYDSISGQMDFTFYKPHRKPSSPSAEWIPVYSSPTSTPRQPLTDEQADELVRRFARYELLRAVEAAHGIKGKHE